MPTYYTYKDQVPLLPGQTLGFSSGHGYYAAGSPAPPTPSRPASSQSIANSSASSGGAALTATQPVAAATSQPPARAGSSGSSAGTTYYTYRADVPLQPGQVVDFTAGRGYYATTPSSSSGSVAPPLQPSSQPPTNAHHVQTAAKGSAVPNVTTGAGHVGTPRPGASSAQTRVMGQLFRPYLAPSQINVARTVYRIARTQGHLSRERALEVVAAAFQESSLGLFETGPVITSGPFAGQRAGGVFQLLSTGYIQQANKYGGVTNTRADELAILLPIPGSSLPSYVGYWRDHPNAPPGAAASYVEGSGQSPSWYAQSMQWLATYIPASTR